MGQPILILASNSPRRRELLALGGWSFSIQPAEVDESQCPGETPTAYVLRLAESKARACQAEASAHSAQVVMAADTTVVDRGTILGKPKDGAEAVEMLRRLRDRTHQVYTGIAVMRLSDGKIGTDLCVTAVPMRSYNDEEIDAYVATGDPLDKAGAYGIQHIAFHPVALMSGCFASVMGLPLCHLARTLHQFDIPTEKNVSAECQSTLNYSCPVSASVLRGEQVG
jgi:septum formation protein